MSKRQRIVPGNKEMLDRFGVKLGSIRCSCGHKLMEVEKRSGSVIRVKCRSCGRIVRIEL